MDSFQNFLQMLDVTAMGRFLLRFVGVFFCLTVHETSHAAVALALGDPTAKQLHRISLNPFRHIDWMGLAMMLVCGFGWAKAVPVDMRYFKKPKQGMALTALAGPVSNFVLAAALLFGTRLIYQHIAYHPFWDTVLQFLLDTAALSIGLGLFNLLPIPPLDGSKVVGALLPDAGYEKLMRFERYGMVVLLLLAVTDVGSQGLSRVISFIYEGMINFIVLG